VVDDEVEVQVELAKEGLITLRAAKMLVSVGRQANTEELGLENTDVVIERGFIKVNAYYQTAEPHIYAIGDVNGGLQLAHAAGHEGLQAVEHICADAPGGAAQDALVAVGSADHSVNTDIPRCIYSHPEVASVGLTEAAARAQGRTLKIGKIPFQAIGKAHVYGDPSGFAKVVADAHSGDILGVHLIGAHATDLISEAALALVVNATPWEVAQVVHPHPTLSEIMGETMMAVDGQAIAF
jgi:dihydrolipoamide dehydrogenase